MNRFPENEKLSLCLPCPYCGSMYLGYEYNSHGFVTRICCDECGVHGPKIPMQYGTKDACIMLSIMKWNTRVIFGNKYIFRKEQDGWIAKFGNIVCCSAKSVDELYLEICKYHQNTSIEQPRISL